MKSLYDNGTVLLDKVFNSVHLILKNNKRLYIIPTGSQIIEMKSSVHNNPYFHILTYEEENE